LLNKLAYNDATSALIDYWYSLPRPEGALCPYHKDIDLSALGKHADYIFLDEWHNEDVVCVIHSGEALNTLLGTNLTGSNIMLLFSENEFSIERKFFKAIFTQPCAGLLARHGSTVSGTHFIYRTTYLPLLSISGKTRFAIGTGAMLEGNTSKDDYGYTDFGDLELLEREVFDIGAGIPDLELMAEPSHA
jgi:hypothetical protein